MTSPGAAIFPAAATVRRAAPGVAAFPAAATSSGAATLSGAATVTDRSARAALALRHGADLVVAMARTTRGGRDHWFAYVIDHVVLVEEISSAGVHRFAVTRDERLLDLVVAAAVHPDSGDAIGPAVALPPAEDAANPETPAQDAPAPETPAPAPASMLGRLGAASLRADLVVRHVGERHTGSLGLFSGPGGSWLVTGRGTTTPIAHPLAVAELREQLRQYVGHIRLEASNHAGR